MKNNTIIKVENLSKQYRLGSISSKTLSDDIKRWWYKIRGKEDPFLKIGETNDRSIKGDSEYVWALKDINFEVQKGEVLGIIGKNGAGKSTLLKILSKITSPTTGSIKFNGRIASLLEVGTGFHPELTGRENVFLNGAILGMTKKEVASKLDEIISFSGCERYIDTPVKRYSSGMRVRLAFAVAAFLEPDILIIDEVLAVGDAEFQKKAIGKMQDISKGEGRTVLFVSHNMAVIRKLCNQCILLENGLVAYQDETDKVIKHYLENNIAENKLSFDFKINELKDDEIKQFKLVNKNNNIYNFNESIHFYLEMKIKSNINYIVAIYLRNSFGEVVFFSESMDNNLILNKNKNETTITIPPNILLEDTYYVTIGCKSFEGVALDVKKDLLKLVVQDTINLRKKRLGNVFVNLKWS